MEIRATEKDYKRFKKYKTDIQINKDENLGVSVFMVESEGKLIEWTRGRKNIESFLKLGYVAIRKNCPHRIGKCIGEKCSFYNIKNGTGDCAIIWNII